MSRLNQFGNNSTLQTIIQERRNDVNVVDALRRDLTFAKFIPQVITDLIATVSQQVNIVMVNTSSGAVIVTLPNALDMQNRYLHVKDRTGNAGVNSITVNTVNAQTIDGAATASIASNYGALMLYCDGNTWYKL